MQADFYQEYLRKAIIRDRYEVLKKIKAKSNEVELNVSSDYFERIIKQYIRTNDEDKEEHKINEDDGYGEDRRIKGDFSYNIIVYFIY